jgi:hypothetical protein
MGAHIVSDTGTAVARHAGVQSIGKQALKTFDAEQVELIRDTVAKDASPAEFAMFLDMAARYELNPLAKEIFCAKMKGKDGGSGRVAIIVGRDGLLKIARRSDEFEGIEGDVVRENDTFSKDSDSILPKHSYTGHALPPKADGKFPEGSRGAIVGAWAVAYRKDCKPTYFYAPWSEYVPNADRAEKTPWGKNESAMILKCAQSLALRLAFSITGVHSEEEMAHVLVQEQADVGLIEWGDDPVLADWLPRLFAAANEVRDEFRPAKIRMLLSGSDHEQRLAIADEVVEFIQKHGGEVPEPRSAEDLAAEQQERMAAAEEEVVPPEETEVMQDGDDDPEA